jgi:hypothetical protein
MSGIERPSRRAEVRKSRGMRWQLATWLDKHETPEGEHRISVVRDIDNDEVDRIREAIRVVHAYIVREPFVLVVQNQMEYQSFEDYVRSRARDDPLPLLQADAQELGSGLRFRFLNWLLSFKTFLDLTEADLHRRFGADSYEVAAFQDATRSEFDSSFGYRFMARLRNFGQHAEFPPLEGRIEVAVDDDGRSMRTIVLYLDRDKLLEWARWTVLRAELEAQAPQIPVVEHMDAAMDSLTTIAAVVKRLDLPTLEQAALLLNSLWDETNDSPGVPLIGIIDAEGEGGLQWLWIPKLRIAPGG